MRSATSVAITSARRDSCSTQPTPPGRCVSMDDSRAPICCFRRPAILRARPVVVGLLSTPIRTTQTDTSDANGTVASTADALGNTTTFTYEPAFSQLTSVTDAIGHVTTFDYDGRGNLLRVTDANGNTPPNDEK